MEKRNQDYCKADAIAGLAALVNSDAEHVTADYGLLEALASDTLSPNEARRFAEHLETCEECRRECAAMWAAGLYDDAPFGDRMRAFESAPASETDENWKAIAVAFNENLASAAKRSVVSFAESVADDLYVAPEFKQALAVWEASKPKARPSAAPRRSLTKWSAFAYSAAGVLAGLVAAQLVGVRPNAPELVPCYAPIQLAQNPTVSENPEETLERTLGGDSAGSQTLGGSRGMSGTRGGDVAPIVLDAEESDPPQSVAAEKSGGPKVAKSIPFGVQKGGLDAKTYESLRPGPEPFETFGGAVVELHEAGVEAFNGQNFEAAIQNFAKLVEQLKGKTGGEEALIAAYWNLGVAKAQNNDQAGAAEAWRELEKMNLNDSTRASVEDALKVWKGTSENVEDAQEAGVR